MHTASPMIAFFIAPSVALTTHANFNPGKCEVIHIITKKETYPKQLYYDLVFFFFSSYVMYFLR